MKLIPEPAARTLSELLALVSLSCFSSTSTKAPSGMKKKNIAPADLTRRPEAPGHYPVRGLVDDHGDDDRHPSVDYRHVGVDPGEEEVRKRSDGADVAHRGAGPWAQEDEDLREYHEERDPPRYRHQVEHEPGQRLGYPPLAQAVHEREARSGAQHHDAIGERDALHVRSAKMRNLGLRGNALSVHPFQLA